MYNLKKVKRTNTTLMGFDLRMDVQRGFSILDVVWRPLLMMKKQERDTGFEGFWPFLGCIIFKALTENIYYQT